MCKLEACLSKTEDERCKWHFWCNCPISDANGTGRISACTVKNRNATVLFMQTMRQETYNSVYVWSRSPIISREPGVPFLIFTLLKSTITTTQIRKDCPIIPQESVSQCIGRTPLTYHRSCTRSPIRYVYQVCREYGKKAISYRLAQLRNAC